MLQLLAPLPPNCAVPARKHQAPTSGPSGHSTAFLSHMQVSKSWLAAVDLEVRHLAEGSHLPRDLASRFPGLRTLDLEYCDRRVSAKQLTHALLHLPSLEALLNVYNLDWVSLLLGRKSASDRSKVGSPPWQQSKRASIWNCYKPWPLFLICAFMSGGAL